MIKCKWRNDGIFEGCESSITETWNCSHTLSYEVQNNMKGYSRYFIFCPFCGADIRKPEEPKQPTHEEIMKPGLYWKWENRKGIFWHKILAYIPHEPNPYKVSSPTGFTGYRASGFVGRESANIPPEGETQ